MRGSGHQVHLGAVAKIYEASNFPLKRQIAIRGETEKLEENERKGEERDIQVTPQTECLKEESLPAVVETRQGHVAGLTNQRATPAALSAYVSRAQANLEV